MSELTYTEALNRLVEWSEWARGDVQQDPSSAAWAIYSKVQQAVTIVERGSK